MSTYDCCACGGAEGLMPCALCTVELCTRKTNAEKVGQFHRAFSVAEPASPLVPSKDVLTLRSKLISEEFLEVMDELHDKDPEDVDLAALAKELADLLVVTYGTARACGIDIDAVFEAVHASNMSKLGEDGKPVLRPDGKVMKGPNYKPADVESVLRG